MDNASPSTSPNDLTFGRFSSTPPWELPSADMPWQKDIEDIRKDNREALLSVARSHGMPNVFRLFRIYKNLAVAVVPWLIFNLRKFRKGNEQQKNEAGERLARRLRRAFERLGPVFVKMAQFVSATHGILPEAATDEFKKCRDQVKPESYKKIRKTIEEDFGRPLEEIFASFSSEPIASASIAQVHDAQLLTGEKVVVKVQRSVLKRRVPRDIRVLSMIARLLKKRVKVIAIANPPAIVELFAEFVSEELDFRVEAQNMLDIAGSFVRLGQGGFIVPRPHPELVTPRVLVMEKLDGVDFEDVKTLDELGIDRLNVVRTQIVGFLEGALIEGVFHGDIHGGNMLILRDGRIGLLDYGIVGRLTTKQRKAFLSLLVAASNIDIQGQLRALQDLGALGPDADLAKLEELMFMQMPENASKKEISAQMQTVLKTMLDSGSNIPKELALFVKNMLFLNGAIAELAPELDLLTEISAIGQQFMLRHAEELFGEMGFMSDSFGFDLTGIRDFIKPPAADPDLNWDLLLGTIDKVRENEATNE